MAKPAGQGADPAVFLCWQGQGRGGYSGLWHGGGRPGGQGGRAHDPPKELGGVCPAGNLLTGQFLYSPHFLFHSICLPVTKIPHDIALLTLRQML